MNDELIKAFLKTMNEVDEEMRVEFSIIQLETIELKKKYEDSMRKLDELTRQASVLTKFRQRFENKFLGEDSQEAVIHHPAQVN